MQKQNWIRCLAIVMIALGSIACLESCNLPPINIDIGKEGKVDTVRVIETNNVEALQPSNPDTVQTATAIASIIPCNQDNLDDFWLAIDRPPVKGGINGLLDSLKVIYDSHRELAICFNDFKEAVDYYFNTCDFSPMVAQYNKFKRVRQLLDSSLGSATVPESPVLEYQSELDLYDNY